MLNKHSKWKKKKCHVRNRNLFNFLIGRNRNLDKANWKKNTRKMNYEKRKTSISSFILFLYFYSFPATKHSTFNSAQIKSNKPWCSSNHKTLSPSPNSQPIPPLLPSPSVGILGFGMNFRLGLIVLNLLLD